MESIVVCQICNHSSATLARHLKLAHGITACVYRKQFPDARIRSEQCEANRRAAITKSHSEKPTKGSVKTVMCPCGTHHNVSRFDRKAARCLACQLHGEANRISPWEGKSEILDFVTCVGCAYKAENLTSHVQNDHSEWVGCYPGVMVSLNSRVRDKEALRGRSLSEEIRSKMSARAGRWNKGLTKETDKRVAGISKHRIGQPSWSKGLTKAEHPGLQRTSEKLAKWVGPIRYWSSNPIVRLEKNSLLQYTLGNGKVSISQAMIGLGYTYTVIRRECDRHGLLTSHCRIHQTVCLDAISKALGGVYFQQEWVSVKFTNSKTGKKFRYDGFFPSHRLIVEFHGYQHYVFPSVYIKLESQYRGLQERDVLKENLIRADPDLRYFSVREDEPYANVAYLRNRLMDDGVLSQRAC